MFFKNRTHIVKLFFDNNSLDLSLVFKINKIEFKAPAAAITAWGDPPPLCNKEVNFVNPFIKSVNQSLDLFPNNKGSFSLWASKPKYIFEELIIV